MSLIKLEKISKTYKMGKVNVQALSDVSLNIEKGSFTGIIGPSGSGKTTLLNILGCLDKQDEGLYFFEGKDISTLSNIETTFFRREKFGFIFQTFNLIPVLTVYENVEIPLALLNVEPKERKERIMNILKEVGIEETYNRLPSELSGGQQQRVAIARALVKNPIVIFADEPTANLDHATGTKIIDLMKNLNQKLGITFIFSTHDSKIMNAANQLIVLEDGRISN
ncbi:MAG TPA: ABC transporter ATP-binding protein [Exilispira sp.]|nr:ABC transporter ATP-binding protein [Exilispira sp.]